MRIYITGDLHGRMPTLKDIEGSDVIICPGDICGDHGIRPLVIKSLKQFTKTGEYINWWEHCGKKKARKLVKESVQRGRKILEKLNSYGVPVFTVPGNWDWTGDEDWEFLWPDYFQEIIDELDNVTNIDMIRRTVKDLSFVGFGHSNGPELVEHRGYDDLTQEDIQIDRENYRVMRSHIYKKVREAPKPLVFLNHNVPFDTKLDLIDNPDSDRHGMHFGSNISRDVIDKYQPPLCIGAHMHETFGGIRLGKTTCINTGYGVDKHTIAEWDGKRFKITFHPKKDVVVKLK